MIESTEWIERGENIERSTNKSEEEWTNWKSLGKNGTDKIPGFIFCFTEEYT